MCIVLKFGGTSLGTIEQIRNVAKIIAKHIATDKQVVVVVSAMATTTNTLVEYSNFFKKINNKREYDQIISSGEQVSSGLVALALEELGFFSKSLLAWQVPIITNKNYSNAYIDCIKTNKINSLLANRVIPVIAGFQGITNNYDVTTLGRGGGDITAVSVSVALNARACYIYTDVDGVYTVDPRINNGCKPKKNILSNVMLNMADAGCGVIHGRAVEMIRKYKVPVYVKSSFIEGAEGTFVQAESNNKNLCEGSILEEPVIEGIVLSTNSVIVEVDGLSQKNTSVKTDLLQLMLSEGISPEILTCSKEESNVSFLASRDSLNKLMLINKAIAVKSQSYKITFNSEISKISIVGFGLMTRGIIMQSLFNFIDQQESRVLMFNTSGTIISIVIEDKGNSQAIVNSLYDIYSKFILK